MKRNDAQRVEAANVTERSLETEHNDNVLDFSATLRELRTNIEPSLLRQREAWRDSSGRARTVEYIEWHSVADILDEKAPHWAHSIKDIREIGEIVTVTVAISIDGVTREGIGTGSARTETGIKKAEHDALKRAAVKFGIARELYKSEFERESNFGEPEVQQVTTAYSGDPIAATLGEMLTARQMGMIRAIARENNFDADAECRELLRCSVAELSRRSASTLIDHLKAKSDMAMPLRKAS